MSDDLISRKELWEEIVRLEELARRRVLDTPISSPFYQRYSTQLNERTNLKHIIADAKTAYDVDNVVEQLENAMGLCDGFVDSANSEYEADRWTHKAEAYGEAIEIVKAGGKNE
jgi:6-phosphogluconate dehydrogenase (decarboxylating)